MNNTDELGNWKDEVDELRDEEKHHGLAEVAEDSNHCERHAGTVAEGVSYKDFAWESIVLQQSKRAKQERDHNSERVHVVLHDLLALSIIKSLLVGDLYNVVDHDEAPNNKRLTSFYSVNPCINVDCIRAEDGDVSHIDMIEYSQIYVATKKTAQKLWDNNWSQAFVCH